MRGPLLSGPLGSAASLEAVSRRMDNAAIAVVIGPLWLAEVLSTRVRVLLLTEPEERVRAVRVAKRARAAGQRLTVVIAGVDLPLGAGCVDALLIESASTLDPEALTRWMTTLVPLVRPGGCLVALDGTDDAAAEARLAGLFLGAALCEIVQERPRAGVVLTVGIAPSAPVTAARFGPAGAIAGSAAIDRG
ncbi:MAG: hypothetical protein H7X95_04715 [Deltaproteobacteria bacterium]|nr:hypothetical protein [Deltaproteobacteria bacterium]